MNQPYGQQPAPKKGMSTGLIILIVAAVTIVPVLGILAVMSIYGVRKYVSNAKSAEAKNALGQIARDAVNAYEKETLSGETRRVCPSATTRVPADRNMVSGRKYQSSAAEWQVDQARDAGFACLKFEMTAPQYFQYEYEATRSGFIARAYGDQNGDGVFSTFEIKGQVVGERLVISPSILETNAGE
jgi:type IV pilus assembly protein PilA